MRPPASTDSCCDHVVELVMAGISPAMTREYKETLVVPQFEFDRPSRTEASRHDCPMYAASRFLVLFGAACLTVVVLTHVAETFGILPGMGWNMPNSAGHYLDLVSAILGCTLLPAGLIASFIARRKNSN